MNDSDVEAKERGLKRELYDIIHDLQRNYPGFPSTFGPCINQCGNHARGGGYCADCCEKQLASLTGSKKLASELHFHIKRLSALKAEMEVIVEDKEDDLKGSYGGTDPD